MKKENIRSKLTKEKIINSWLKLAEDNHCLINVKEICKEAGINRSTFYAYYFDINDLVNEIENKIDLDIKTLLSKNGSQGPNMYEEFIQYLTYIKANYKKIHACLSTFPNGFLTGEITKIMRQAICHYYPKKESESNNVYAMIVGFYQAGLYQVINKWILSDCEEEIESVFYAIQCCMNKSI